MTEAIGWLSSIVLLLTIGKQVHKQWREGSSEGVSKWLFVGQITASIGFTIYSWQVRNWVFVVTNALMACNAVVGLIIVRVHRRRAHRSTPARSHQLPSNTGNRTATSLPGSGLIRNT